MNTVISNENNITDEKINEKKFKVRAILKDDNGNLMISNYGGVFLFPGGSIEADEDIYEAIQRELKEETGVEYTIEDLYELVKYEQYQANYPKRDGTTINRKVTTYYFYGQSKGINYKNLHLTKGEIKDNFYSLFTGQEELMSLIEHARSINPRSDYFNEEIQSVLNEYNKVIKSQSKTKDYE